MLDAVGLSDRARYQTSDLPGGQQQRVAIARALVRRPPLVLGDEPTGHVDTASANEVFELMRRFNRESARIADRCDRAIAIRGRTHRERRRADAARVTHQRW